MAMVESMMTRIVHSSRFCDHALDRVRDPGLLGALLKEVVSPPATEAAVWAISCRATGIAPSVASTNSRETCRAEAAALRSPLLSQIQLLASVAAKH